MISTIPWVSSSGKTYTHTTIISNYQLVKFQKNPNDDIRVAKSNHPTSPTPSSIAIFQHTFLIGINPKKNQIELV